MTDWDALAALMVDLDVPPLGQRYTKPRWMKDGLCLEFPDVEFFPMQGQPTEPAKVVCRHCIVRDECLAYALESDYETFGIWGGYSAVEIRRLKRERKAA